MNLDEDIGPQECDRILAISCLLRDGKPHKAKEIAITLGMHVTKVRRYIEYMRGELKLPIQAGRQGFFVDSSTTKDTSTFL